MLRKGSPDTSVRHLLRHGTDMHIQKIPVDILKLLREAEMFEQDARE